MIECEATAKKQHEKKTRIIHSFCQTFIENLEY